MKILIVDDSKSVQAFVREILEPLNFEMTFVFNGNEALSAIASQSFDLVLMDWEMPVMTGPEALKVLRADKSNPPVIMMTTRSATRDLETAVSLGVSEYVMKPFTSDILLAKIDQIMGTEFANAG